MVETIIVIVIILFLGSSCGMCGDCGDCVEDSCDSCSYSCEQRKLAKQNAKEYEKYSFTLDVWDYSGDSADNRSVAGCYETWAGYESSYYSGSYLFSKGPKELYENELYGLFQNRPGYIFKGIYSENNSNSVQFIDEHFRWTQDGNGYVLKNYIIDKLSSKDHSLKAYLVWEPIQVNVKFSIDRALASGSLAPWDNLIVQNVKVGEKLSNKHQYLISGLPSLMPSSEYQYFAGWETEGGVLLKANDSSVVLDGSCVPSDVYTTVTPGSSYVNNVNYATSSSSITVTLKAKFETYKVNAKFYYKSYHDETYDSANSFTMEFDAGVFNKSKVEFPENIIFADAEDIIGWSDSSVQGSQTPYTGILQSNGSYEFYAIMRPSKTIKLNYNVGTIKEFKIYEDNSISDPTVQLNPKGLYGWWDIPDTTVSGHKVAITFDTVEHGRTYYAKYA